MSKNIKLKTILDGDEKPLKRVFNKARSAARTAAGRIAGYFRKAGSVSARAFDKIMGMKVNLGWLTGMAASFGALGYVVTKLGADYESLTKSFEKLTGGAKNAKKVLADLTKFSVSTPFEPDEVYEAGKILLAFGEDQAKLIPTLKAIGDVASGVGMPLNELAQIYGKVMTKGKAQTEELNQMAERGIPIIQALAKMFGKTEAEIYKMAEAGELSFDVIKRAFQEMTSEGGMFNGMMQEQSQTLNGIMSTLIGNVKELAKNFSSQWIPELKEAAKWANSIAAAINQARADGEKFNIKSDDKGDYANRNFATKTGHFLTNMFTFGNADNVENWLHKFKTGEGSRSVTRANLSAEESATLKQNARDKKANPGKTIPQINAEAAAAAAKKKQDEKDTAKRNSVNSAVDKLFASGGGLSSGDPFEKRKQYIDKYLEKAKAAAKKLGAELSPEQEKEVRGRAAGNWDQSMADRRYRSVEKQLSSMRENTRLQRLLVSGKEKEYFIQQQLSAAAKKAAALGLELTDTQKERIKAAAEELYQAQQDKKANDIAAKGNRDLSDRLSRIGGTIGGQGAGNSNQERRENEKVSLLKAIKDNTEDLENDDIEIK